MNMQTAIQREIDTALPFTSATADYETVRRAIAFVSENFREQPEVEAVAEAAGTTPRAVTELFRRWCGLTPKELLAGGEIDHAVDPREPGGSMPASSSAFPAPASYTIFRRARGDVNGKGLWWTADRYLRFPPIAVRNRARHGNRAGAMRACLRRRR